MFDNDSLGLQCVLPYHSSTGVPGGWESDNYRAIVETNRSWSLAIHNLHNWLHNNFEPVTTYAENTFETRQVKDSVIGRTITEYFENKNKNKLYCEDWEGVTNFGVGFPGWSTLKYIFDREFKMAMDHSYRFFSSLDNGVISFIGTSDAVVNTEIIEIGIKKYIKANFIVYNSTSLKSAAYHLVPECLNGKIWRQEYHWSNIYECCPLPEAEKYQRHVINGLNCFPYNLYDRQIECPPNPFSCIPSI